MKKEKLVCDCGCKKFTRSMNMMDNVVLTVNPPIQVSVYVCEKCGKRLTIHKREFLTQQASEVIIDGRVVK